MGKGKAVSVYEPPMFSVTSTWQRGVLNQGPLSPQPPALPSELSDLSIFNGFANNFSGFASACMVDKIPFGFL